MLRVCSASRAASGTVCCSGALVSTLLACYCLLQLQIEPKYHTRASGLTNLSGMSVSLGQLREDSHSLFDLYAEFIDPR
jgi:hypothetical protein